MNQLALAITNEHRTQKADLLDYLSLHGSITRFEAAFELGIMELSSRIGEIEKMGYVIPREPHHGVGRNGRRFVVTRYLRPRRVG